MFVLESSIKSMFCHVYKSRKKIDTYLYMPKDQAFENLPDDLQRVFGEPVFVMELTLSPERNLARFPASEVINAMRERGYFLQLPPTV